jgi:transposase
LELLTDRLVLAHPKKPRIIAESTGKSDQLDAQVLAEFLARGVIPESYRPTPRQRQRRRRVRQRFYLRRRAASARTKIRRIVADYNADRKDLFSTEGPKCLKQLPVSKADRSVLDQLRAEWTHHLTQLRAAEQRLRQFAREASTAEAEARQVLGSIPGVGEVTVDIVVSGIGGVNRFRSIGEVVAYAGLAPGRRESAGKARDLGITKDGSRPLRWALVETAWRLVRQSPRWQHAFARLHRPRGKKKAIVAIARRLLGVMAAVWRKGEKYRLAV